MFAPAGVEMQTWSALVLLLLFVVVFSLSQPYEQTYLNRLERSALSINVITLLCGLGLFTNDGLDEDAKSQGFALLLTLCIVGLNAMFVVNVGRTFVEHSTYCIVIKKWRRKQKNAETTTTPAVVVVPKHLYVLKMQSQVRASVLMQRAKADVSESARGKPTNRLRGRVQSQFAHSVVKNASEQAQLKIKQLEKRKKKSLSRLQFRLNQRKSLIPLTTLLTTEPNVAKPIPANVLGAVPPPIVDPNNSEVVSELKRTKYKASLVTALKSKEHAIIEERSDPTTGRVYYVDKVTGHSTWTDPRRVDTTDLTTTASTITTTTPTNDNMKLTTTTVWIEQMDPSSGRVYYANKVTGETSWTKPIN
jgi:hypothetical protein